MKAVLYWLALPVRVVRWFFHEGPWRWRPGIRFQRHYWWSFCIRFYINWTPDNLMDFDEFGLDFDFASWSLTFFVDDND